MCVCVAREQTPHASSLSIIQHLKLGIKSKVGIYRPPRINMENEMGTEKNPFCRLQNYITLYILGARALDLSCGLIDYLHTFIYKTHTSACAIKRSLYTREYTHLIFIAHIIVTQHKLFCTYYIYIKARCRKNQLRTHFGICERARTNIFFEMFSIHILSFSVCT